MFEAPDISPEKTNHHERADLVLTENVPIRPVRGGGPKEVGLIHQRLESRYALDFPPHRWSDP